MSGPERLRKRADFVAAASGQKWHGGIFTIQSRGRPQTDTSAELPRVGLTLTKKAGNAVARNRMRRRLREALRLTAHLPARTGHDYVLIVRRKALTASFAAIGAELARGFEQVHLRKASVRDAKTAPGAGRPSRDSQGS